MSKATVEERLTEVTKHLDRVRREMKIVEEQLAVMERSSEDLRIRAMVSETMLANREHELAERHAEAMRRSRDAVAVSLSELTSLQDQLLSKWASEAS